MSERFGLGFVGRHSWIHRTPPLASFFSEASGPLSLSTGKERDTESGLDYFGARYYASNMGRWMSPDWASKPSAVPYAELGDPQSLNLYSYVRNNPLSHADVDGHWDPWEHVWIAQMAYAQAHLSPNSGVITGIRNVDGAGHNPYTAWAAHPFAWHSEQYSHDSQADHFLRDSNQTQMQAYDAGMAKLTASATAARSAMLIGDQAVATDAMSMAGHLIADSFAHTTRDGGDGAITHIQCFTCSSGAGYDHQHPDFSDGNGLAGPVLTPQAQGAVNATADFLTLMNGAANMTNQQFQQGLSSYENKYFQQNLPKQ